MTRAVGHGAYPVRIPLPLPSGHIGLLHLEKELTPAGRGANRCGHSSNGTDLKNSRCTQVTN